MKKLISMFLVLVLFIGFCPVTLAGGIDKVEILSDGTKLTYVSTENLESARQMFADRINKNRERKFSAFGNLAMKAASFAGGTLLRYAESKIENVYLRIGLIICTGLASFLSFFYPEYVRYDVYRIEERTPLVHAGYSVETGLKAFINEMDNYIKLAKKGSILAENGIIIVERPKGYKTKSDWGVLSGVHNQDPYRIGRISNKIEHALKHNLDKIKD